MRKKRNKFTRKNTKTKYRKRTRKKYTKKRNKRGGSADQWPDYVTNGALCYKQKPWMTSQWPERYVKIEDYSLNFYDANRPLLGSGSDDSLPEMGVKRGSSIKDVSGCTVSMGTERFGLVQKRYLPKVILKRNDEVIVQMAFEEEARANKFHEILTNLVKKKHTAARKAERDESDRFLDEIHALQLQRRKLPDRAAAALTGRENPLSRGEMNQLISDMMDEKIREEEDMLQADQPELPPASPTAVPPSGIEPDMPPPAEAPLAEAPLAEAQPAEPQDVLREKLIAKGFNLEGLIFVQLDPRSVEISKQALNKDKIVIPMSIMLKINNWGGEREYENLELDDFYISGIFNGTAEQAVAGIDVNKGLGVFTGFLKEFLSDVQTFYVTGASPYWARLFDCVSGGGRGITKCNIKAQTVNKIGAGRNIRYKRKRKRTKRTKRRKSKKKTRKKSSRRR